MPGKNLIESTKTMSLGDVSTGGLILKIRVNDFSQMCYFSNWLGYAFV